MMGAAAKLTDDDIKAIADAVLGSEMADLGFEGVEVRHREIYPDEPSLFVRAKVAEEVPAPFDAWRGAVSPLQPQSGRRCTSRR